MEAHKLMQKSKLTSILLSCLIVSGTIHPMNFDVERIESAWRSLSSKIFPPPMIEKPAPATICCICSEKLDKEPTIQPCKICKTEFHKKCLLSWAKQHGTCPRDGQELTVEMLIGTLSPSQVKKLNALTVAEGALTGIGLYLTWKQSRDQTLTLQLIGLASPLAARYIDNYFYPQPSNLPSLLSQVPLDQKTELRRSVISNCLVGALSLPFSSTRALIMRTTRPFVKQGVNTGGKFILEKTAPDFDYQVANKTYKRPTLLLTAGGVCIGLVAGKCIENTLQNMINS